VCSAVAARSAAAGSGGPFSQRTQPRSEPKPSRSRGDTNLLNIIASEQAVHLIDWDFPMVRYPLAELSALDEHAYLHGLDGLPAAFFAGYGEVSAGLLVAYRIVGCFGWLSGDDWDAWNSDPSLPVLARIRLHRWHRRLEEWAKATPGLSAALV